MIIVFCETCGLRIAETEIAEQRARKVDDHLWICAGCCAAPAPTSADVPVESPPAEKPVLRQKETRSITASLRPKPSIPPKKALPRNAMVPVIAGGIVFLLIIGFVLSRPTQAPQGQAAPPTPNATVVETTKSPPKTIVTAEQTPLNTPATPKPGPSVSQTMAERMRESQSAMENIRDQRAMTLLDEHKLWFANNATRAFEYRERLQSLLTTYRSSPASKEADKLLSELKFAEVKGRFVRLELSGAGRVLSLAEVQIFCKGVNIAPKGKAKQSSEAYDAIAARAIDGTTNGIFKSNSTTHTAVNDNPWWEVELADETAIQAIVIWNRTDCCPERLKDLKISVLGADRAEVWTKTVNEIPNPKYVLEMN